MPQPSRPEELTPDLTAWDPDQNMACTTPVSGFVEPRVTQSRVLGPVDGIRKAVFGASGPAGR